jgi:hypothetical protein
MHLKRTIGLSAADVATMQPERSSSGSAAAAPSKVARVRAPRRVLTGAGLVTAAGRPASNVTITPAVYHVSVPVQHAVATDPNRAARTVSTPSVASEPAVAPRPHQHAAQPTGQSQPPQQDRAPIATERTEASNCDTAGSGQRGQQGQRQPVQQDRTPTRDVAFTGDPSRQPAPTRTDRTR